MSELAPLTAESARVLIDEVKADAENLWRKLVGLYERQAYRLAGYSSWGEFFKAELGGEKSQAYRILDAGRVAAILGDSPNGESRLKEAQARELVPLVNAPDLAREAWQEAREQYGSPSAAEVRQVVDRKRGLIPTPVDPDLAAYRRRRMLISDLDQAVSMMESLPSVAIDEARLVLSGNSAGPLTAERFERVALYAQTFANELRRLEVVA